MCNHFIVKIESELGIFEKCMICGEYRGPNMYSADMREIITELRSLIGKDIDSKIDVIIERKLSEWFQVTHQKSIEDAVRAEFEKIMIVKLR